jgi:RNA polymerase sigma-70 factor (ECF subfamily)
LNVFLTVFIKRKVAETVHRLAGRSDEDLYARFANGDERAFRVLLERHGGRVHGYLTRFFRDPEMAADLTQDVFLRVIASAGDFRGDSSFRTFLYRVVRNLCIDTMRSRRSRPDGRAISLDAPMGGNDDGPRPMDSVSGNAPTGELRTLSGELSGAMEEALARLPAEQREVFLMREVEGLKFREIADVLDVNENTVKSRMHYAITSLRESLQAFGGRS